VKLQSLATKILERFIAVTALLALAGCTAPTAPPIVTATPAPPTSIPATPTASPTATVTPTPTLAPDAIGVATAAKIGKALWLTDNGGPVYGLAVSPDGSLVAEGGLDWIVRIFDGYTGHRLQRLEHHRHNIYAMVWSPDGRYFVSGSRDETVQIWTPDGQRVIGMHTTGQIVGLAYAPDGSSFASVGLYSSIGEVWQSGTGAALFTLEGHKTRLRSVAYSADSAWIATGDKDDVVVFHDSQTGQPLASVSGTKGEAQAIAFSPDGRTMAVGTLGGYIELWNLSTRSLEGTIEAHSQGVNSLTYSRDGSLLISAGGDGVIRLWDTLTGKKVRSLTGHGGAVNGIGLSQDGRTLASASSDGTLIVWRVAP
jgi:WD40 repeat protein